MRTRAMSAGREWKIFDTWFRARLEDELRLEEIEAEKISRFILSLFLNQDDIDYKRERELFKYSKNSPNGRPKMVSEDYTDSKSPTEMAIDEIFSISPLDAPEDEVYALVIEIITQLKSKIETGVRKRKISEAQSTTSTRSSSSSSSTYEDEFPPIDGSTPSPLIKETYWVTSRPASRGELIEKESEHRRNSSAQFRFAFKNPTKQSTRNRRNKPRKTKSGSAQSNLAASSSGQSGKSTPTQIKDKKGNKTKNSGKDQKQESNRKRKRPRKKKNARKIADEKPGTPTPVSQYENLDNFSSLEDALNFLKTCSAASEPKDTQIWEKVIQDQHVKYVNGSFFFTPRLKQLNDPCHTENPISDNRPVKEDMFLDQAAVTAYGAALKIIDEEYVFDEERVNEKKAEIVKDSKIKSFHWPFPVNNIWSDEGISSDWNITS